MAATIIEQTAPPARSPAGVATVFAFSALPCLVALAHGWRWSDFDWALAFFSYVTVWYVGGLDVIPDRDDIGRLAMTQHLDRSHDADAS